MTLTTSSPRRQAATRKLGLGLSALVCVIFVIAVHRGVSDGQRSYGQTPKGILKEPGGTTRAADEIRGLIGELEAQAEVQRGQLQKTEGSLQRARAILGELERSQTPSESIRHQPLSRRPFNPNDPLRDETLSRQEVAEKTAWSWPVETATPQGCARQFGGGGYDVEITEPKDTTSPSMIQVRKDGRDIISWRAHSASVFVRRGDLLFYAAFSPHSSGCSIVAYHLQQGELWKTPLWGIGRLGQSMYTNRVNMKLDGDNLIVFGDESAGQYIELVDVWTGRVVGRRGGVAERLNQEKPGRMSK
jgi:hypothetical protein